ncbi:hypothetical protein [Helicobacter sp. MIT 01-3238]|uniref:hypothetical protein n=1 Tax=Helicobacter sp. MIT 01-3238 TaxID=398627 RepID=UPI000E1EE5D3|nr:hypothetical protein [Helicobacter sp. MIT 01-3238]RDU52927.1 hypothetical protein CQA40_06400 [Helicobacter sp. MIT 01-3238]
MIEIKIGKFPFVFWFMQKAQASELGTQIEVNAKAYQYKEFSNKKFLLLKYFIPFVFVYLICTRYDFSLSLERATEWFLGLALLIAYKKELFLAFVIVLIFFACAVFMTPAVAAFSVKYFLIALLIKSAYFDYKHTKAFSLYDRGKLVSHFNLTKDSK